MAREKQILVKCGTTSALSEECSTSKESVRKALHFERNSETANKVRVLALTKYKGRCIGTTAATVLKEAGL